MMDMPVITDAERKFIRHALGLSYGKVGYRNRFFAGPKDLQTGLSLKKKALAVHYPEDGSDDLFVITTAGFNAVKEWGETMDREETINMKRHDQRAFVGA